MRKSLKTLHDQLKHFASALSEKNIRYKIGEQCLIIRYWHLFTNDCDRTIEQEDMIYISYTELPCNIFLLNNPRTLRIWFAPGGSIHTDMQHVGIKRILGFLNQEQAWQKKGIDTRKA